MDFVNRVTGSVDEVYELGDSESGFAWSDLASHVLPGECHVLIISHLENVKVCPARGTLKFRVHCLEPCDMCMVPPGEGNYLLLA
jgi:hypothetical protein